ncbi:MAG TPA: VIT domain-containing protein [Pseudonocardiaceae bacterium]
MTTHVDRMTSDELVRHADPLDDAGTGTLTTTRGNLPLDDIDLRATITGLATEIVLTQSFRNPYDEPLEATYIFPLPDRAAVTALRMETPDRVVDGVLRERGEARAAYDNALAAGQRTSIAEEERPGVFTMRVGNIMPAERVTVRLTMAGRLPFEDGAATFRFPLVVAPRYIPGAPLPGTPVGDGTAFDTDAVPDASRISPPVLLPHFPNPVRLSAQVDIDPAGLPLDRISSSLHVTAIDRAGNGTCQVRLAPGDRVNRDFVLRLGFGADSVVSSLAVVPDESGATFACTVLPPSMAVPELPRDVVLVLDRSGSMDGWKMVAARRAAARIVDTLTSADRFAVLTFDNYAETPPTLPPGLVAASDRNRFRAIEHLAGLTARGGTELLTPLSQAVRLFTDDGRDRVIVLVTDGQVGNEDQILHALAPSIGGIRIHTVGVDTAVNEAFLRRLATLAGGRCELVESEDRLDEAMRQIHQRIGRALVTNLRLSSPDLSIDTATIAPAHLPDLYPGAPVVISGRCHGGAAGAVTISGDLPDGTAWQTTADAVPAEHRGLRSIWARAHVRDLEDRYVTAHGDARGGLADLERQIVAVSLEFGVLCRFTAFVAVDERTVNEGGQVHRVTQPVELPQGWQLPTPTAVSLSSHMSVGSAGGPFDMARSRREKRRATPPPAPRLAAQESSESMDISLPVSGSCLPLALPNSPSAVFPVVPPPSLRVFVDQALLRLRHSATLPFAQRVQLLADLGAEITRQLDRFREEGLPKTSVLRLHKLAGTLSHRPTDATELDDLWRTTVDALQSFFGVPQRPRVRPFWKR